MFCLMPRTKFGSDTMLNILATQCVISCCVCLSGCGRGSIAKEHREHEDYVVQPYGLHPRRNRERSWNTSVVLVSSGEAWICTDLIGRGTGLLEFVDLRHSTAPRWLRDAVESRSSREACVTSDDGVYVIFFFAC